MADSSPVLWIAPRPAFLRPVFVLGRSRTNLSPMVATTACAASQAVVTAPTMTMRPTQVSVAPPSVPTFLSHLPS